jgi:predicted CXXCH cytochrome family protein
MAASFTGCKRSASAPALSIAGADAGYVDAATCKGCHSEIWKTYQLTGMGRSFARPTKETLQADFANKNTFYHEASDRHYRMSEREGKYFQRRHQIGFDGRQTNVVEKEIHFVVGSGNHARTFLHRTPEGRIFELPIAWYAEKGGYWAMNPGYDQPNHYDFSREITHECIACHNAYPEIAPGSDRVGSEARFPGHMPEGIDCQRCHGPGQKHVQAAQNGNKNAIRQAIVNPSRLPPDRQLDVCMQCHLETTSTRLPHTVLRFNRGAFSYRPGESLGDIAIHYDHAPGTGRDDKFEIAHHAYRLRKSACFEKSGSRLTCTTCHNPHNVPRGPAAVEHYTSVCRNCHAAGLEKQIAAKKHPGAQNCLDCHMPKRRTDDVIHVVMTDHYIQRRLPARDLLEPLSERHDTEATAYHGAVVRYYPVQLPTTPENELNLAVAQVKQLSNLKDGIPQLVAAIEKHRPQNGEPYFALAEAYASLGQAQDAIRLYEEASRRKPEFVPASLGLARMLAKSDQHARGIEVLNKGLKRKPKDPAILNALGLLYLGQQKKTEAVTAFRAAVESDPEFAEAHNNLGGALSQTGDAAGAEIAYRAAIRIQPDFAAAQRNLANLLAGKGDTSAADYHFRKAIYHNPSYAIAHYDYGVALAGSERWDAARAEFESAVKLDPTMVEAHTGVGDMLSAVRRIPQAIEHYKKALALNPDSAAAHLGMGSALAAQKRTKDALPHLQQAASSTDSSIRQAAQEALDALQPARD